MPCSSWASPTIFMTCRQWAGYGSVSGVVLEILVFSKVLAVSVEGYRLFALGSAAGLAKLPY